MSLKSKLSNLQENTSLASHTTFRIGGTAKYFLAVKNQKDFLTGVRVAKENSLPFYLLGGGSNVLATDEGFDGLVIKIQSSNLKFKNEKGTCKIFAEAGAPFSRIILETSNQGFSEVAWGFGIPGTLGGAVCGNAGRLGHDISQVVESVTILDKNLKVQRINFEECGFKYRNSRFKQGDEIILSADLELKKKDRELTQDFLDQAREVVKHSPKFPSAGCVFKNHEIEEGDSLLQNHPELQGRAKSGKIGVGFLIDRCGLKGKQIGGAKIWEGHANYIVNVGGAKAKDVLALIKICQEAVKEKFSVELEEEIRHLGNF